MKLVVISVKIPTSMLEQIKILSNKKQKTMSEIIREALKKYIMAELYGNG
ncbi:MAG: ribbon-helix-helix protein, CopG family [Ignisphaera sp.]